MVAGVVRLLVHTDRAASGDGVIWHTVGDSHVSLERHLNHHGEMASGGMDMDSANDVHYDKRKVTKGEGDEEECARENYSVLYLTVR